MKKINKRMRLGILFLVEVIVAIIMLVQMINYKKDCIPLNSSMSDWQSDYVNYENGCWEIDETKINTYDTIDFIYGPYMELPKGDYTIQVDYQCDYDQSIHPYAADGKKFYLKYGVETMSRAYNQMEFDFIAKEDVDNFEIVATYGGYGYFRIDQITIVPNNHGKQRALVLYLFAILILDLLWITKEKWKPNQGKGLLLLCIAILVSLPLMMEGMHKGHDMRFHMMRIEGLIHSLQEGQFPVRMNSYWLDGYGYPSSIYYGDYLLMIPALLHMIGFSLLGSYKAFIFGVNLFSTWIAYRCFKKMFQQEKVAMVITFVYISATYRIADIYVRSAVGEYCALIFFPVVGLAMYQILCEKENWKKNALLLAIGMTGIFSTHVLSTEMTAVVLVVLSFLFLGFVLWNDREKLFSENREAGAIRQLMRRLGRILFTYFVAGIITLLCMLWFIIPFLDYYKNVMVSINDTVTGEDVKRIQDSGAYIAQYFAFFQNAFGLGNTGTAIDERMGMTPGAILVVALGLGFFMWYQKKVDNKVKCLCVLSVLSLFAASNLFPWDHLAVTTKLGNSLAQIQFPWRYLSFGCVLLSILLGFLMEQSEVLKQKATIIVVISVVTTLMFVGDYCDNAGVVNYFDGQEVSTYSVGSGEYLRIDYDETGELVEVNLNWLDGQWHVMEGIYDFEIREQKGLMKKCYVEAGPDGGKIEAPLFYYKGYHAYTNQGEEVMIEDGDNFTICVNVPANYCGEITVKWEEPWYWRVSEIVSLLSLAGIVSLVVISKCRIKKLAVD